VSSLARSKTTATYHRLSDIRDNQVTTAWILIFLSNFTKIAQLGAAKSSQQLCPPRASWSPKWSTLSLKMLVYLWCVMGLSNTDYSRISIITCSYHQRKWRQRQWFNHHRTKRIVKIQGLLKASPIISAADSKPSKNPFKLANPVSLQALQLAGIVNHSSRHQIKQIYYSHSNQIREVRRVEDKKFRRTNQVRNRRLH